MICLFGPANTIVLKIVLDTNILIAIIGRKSPYRWVFDRIIQGDIELCVSTEILLEYREILERKTNSIVAENIINFISIHPATQKTKVYFNFNLIDSDPNDNKFVDCLIASNAEFIVSNDRHFEALKEIDSPKVNVVSMDEFESQFK